ncbi:hypothetical protein L2E82_32627 [Cichorium intybus]|uniref:Uncharacterized protein n=1 Tax=Cichorium intybus TaxID=13427 RepID=A0ACB9BHB9_CICIN|nr:hypothetical protein L2E82_32627 [Cichorium intybus]
MVERIRRQMQEVAVNNYHAGVDGLLINPNNELQTEEKKQKQKVDTKKKKTPVVIDNELLQTFSFWK